MNISNHDETSSIISVSSAVATAAVPPKKVYDPHIETSFDEIFEKLQIDSTRDLTNDEIELVINEIFKDFDRKIPKQLHQFFFINQNTHQTNTCLYFEHMCKFSIKSPYDAIRRTYEQIAEHNPNAPYYLERLREIHMISQWEIPDYQAAMLELLRSFIQAQPFIFIHRASISPELIELVNSETERINSMILYRDQMYLTRDMARKLAYWWNIDLNDYIDSSSSETEGDPMIITYFIAWMAPLKERELISKEEMKQYRFNCGFTRNCYTYYKKIASLYETVLDQFNDIDHYFNFYEPMKMEISTFFLNENTRTFLYYQNFERYINQKEMSITRMIFLTFKNWMYIKVPFFHQRNIMMFSSIILYYLGLRPADDLDLIISENLPEYLKNDVIHFFDRRETAIPKFEIQMRGYGDWTPDSYKEQWLLREWPQLIGARDLHDVMHNPRYHGYIMGMKVVTMESDIERRVSRSRPAAFADLFMLRQHTTYPLRELQMPAFFWRDGVQEFYNQDNIPHFLKTVCKAIHTKYKDKRFHVDQICAFLHIPVPDGLNNPRPYDNSRGGYRGRGGGGSYRGRGGSSSGGSSTGGSYRGRGGSH
jgi:hypothetical protein